MDQRRIIFLGALLLSIIAGSLHWYGEGMDSEAAHSDYKHFAPETIVTGFQQTTFSELGIRQYHMKADKVTHYSAQSAAEMKQPVITFYRESADSGTPSDTTDWVAKAKSGVINEDGETLVLSGNVKVIKPLKNAETLSFITESLLIKPKQEIAKTDESVRIEQAQHTTHAKGLYIDIAAGKVELLSQVRSQYVPSTL